MTEFLKDPEVTEALLNRRARHTLHPLAPDSVGADLRSIRTSVRVSNESLLAAMHCATVKPWKSAT